MMAALNGTPSLSMDVKFKSLPRVEAKMPDVINRPMAVQLNASGGSAMTSAARRITGTRSPR
jgi:hypothetical protein